MGPLNAPDIMFLRTAVEQEVERPAKQLSTPPLGNSRGLR